MRSRDLRPFAVEIKNKRRHPAPPASLWADTEALLRAPAEPNGRPPDDRAPIEIRGATAKAAPARRVLPDLRVAEPEPDRSAAAEVPVRDVARSAAEAPAPRAPKPRAKRAAAPETPAPRPKAASAFRRETPAMTEPSDASAGSPIILVPAANEAAIIVPQDDARPARRWARRVEELPRGERWKRRLPDVCR